MHMKNMKTFFDPHPHCTLTHVGCWPSPPPAAGGGVLDARLKVSTAGTFSRSIPTIDLCRRGKMFFFKEIFTPTHIRHNDRCTAKWVTGTSAT